MVTFIWLIFTFQINKFATCQHFLRITEFDFCFQRSFRYSHKSISKPSVDPSIPYFHCIHPFPSLKNQKFQLDTESSQRYYLPWEESLAHNMCQCNLPQWNRRRKSKLKLSSYQHHQLWVNKKYNLKWRFFYKIQIRKWKAWTWNVNICEETVFTLLRLR